MRRGREESLSLCLGWRMSDETLQEKDYSGRVDWRLWARVLRRALTHRRFMLPLAAVAVLTAFVDAGYPLLTKYVLDEVLAHGPAARLWPFAAAYAAMTLALVTCIWAFIFLAGKVATLVGHQMRREGFARLLELSFS